MAAGAGEDGPAFQGRQRQGGGLRRRWAGIRSGLGGAWLLTRAAGASVRASWGLTLISLSSAFAIWMLIQDVENPRTEGLAPPADASFIAVEAVNVPDGFVVPQSPTVRVRVEARKDDIPELRAGDFKATVDMFAAVRGETSRRVVRVESRRDGVRVVAVEPSEVEVSLVQAASRSVQVQLRLTGDPPEGFRVVGAPVIEPAFVQVSGLQQIVDAVAKVELDVNLSGVRGNHEADGELAARTSSGNPVAVRLSEGRARVNFQVEQIFVQRTLPLTVAVTGEPALGFRVSGVAIEPPVVAVTSTQATLESLRAGINVESVDVSGARADVVQTRQITLPPNVVSERRSVSVRIEIQPWECTGAGPPAAPCSSAVCFVAPVFDPAAPPGLVVSGGPYAALVRVSGPLDRMAALRCADIRAVVSLAGVQPGNTSLPVAATAPAGLRVDSADRLTVTIVPLSVP